MDKIASDINNLIKNSVQYKNYVCSQNVINKSVELKKLKEKMQELKNTNCKERNDNLINEYYVLEKQYNEDRCVKEYQEARSELYDLIVDICDILSLK